MGDTKENLENAGTLGVLLGLDIVGKTSENLETLRTLGVPLGLGILGSIRGK